jgi:hypothetical protein
VNTLRQTKSKNFRKNLGLIRILNFKCFNPYNGASRKKKSKNYSCPVLCETSTNYTEVTMNRNVAKMGRKAAYKQF